MEHTHRVAEGAPWFFPLIATMGFVFLLLGTFYFFRHTVLPTDMNITLLLQEENQPSVDGHRHERTKLAKRKRRNLRMNFVVLGNENVGKTSFLKKLLGVPNKLEEPVVELGNRMEPVRMRKDHIVIDFIDTSEKPEFYADLKKSIVRADFIIVMYDVNEPLSRDAVGRKWLPLIRTCRDSANKKMPKLAILGNKVDSNLIDLSERDRDELKGLDKVNIALVGVCSCLTGRNIDRVFVFAHQVVLNPLEPLVDEKNPKKFSVKFLRVLSDIFHFFDKDNDELLNDSEFESLSNISWNEELKIEALAKLKEVLLKDSESNLAPNGTITYMGFCALMQRFIRNGRRDFVWDMIRDFGYDLKLNKTGYSRFEDDEDYLRKFGSSSIDLADI